MAIKGQRLIFVELKREKKFHVKKIQAYMRNILHGTKTEAYIINSKEAINQIINDDGNVKQCG